MRPVRQRTGCARRGRCLTAGPLRKGRSLVRSGGEAWLSARDARQPSGRGSPLRGHSLPNHPATTRGVVGRLGAEDDQDRSEVARAGKGIGAPPVVRRSDHARRHIDHGPPGLTSGVPGRTATRRASEPDRGTPMRPVFISRARTHRNGCLRPSSAKAERALPSPNRRPLGVTPRRPLPSLLRATAQAASRS